MSTKRSKKGFKRLQDHELAEFTSLGNGGPGDSGSESELLDLTTIDEHDSPVCSSCCYWCMCLYVGLLTFVVLIMGVFGGYLAVNMWMMAQNTTDVHHSLEQRIATAEANLDSFKKEINHHLLSLHVSLSSVNSTVATFYEDSSRKHNTTLDALRGFEGKLKRLDERLKVLESSPKETLLSEVDTTKKEMLILGQKLEMLNQSFEDLNGIKVGMAQLDSQISHQDDRLTDVGRQLGDMTKANTDAQNDVANMADKIDQFKSDLSDARTSITTSQEQMKQTSDLLSAKLTHLQTVVVELNDTLIDEVDSLWTNWTQISTRLQTVRNEVSLLQDNVTQLETKTAHVHTSLKPVTTPPIPVTPTTNPNNEPQKMPTTTTPPPPPHSSTERKETPAPEKPSEKSPEESSKGHTTEGPLPDGTTTHSPSGEPVTTIPHSTESQSTGATEDQPHVSGVVNGSLAVEESHGENNSTTNGEGGEGGDGGDGGDSQEDMLAELTNAEQAVSVLKDLLDSFPDLDSNSDDKLTMKEFTDFFPSDSPVAGKIFAALDTDQDLVIARDEITNNLQELEDKETVLKEKLSKDADTDGDGSFVVSTEATDSKEETMKDEGETDVDEDDDDLDKAREQLKEYMDSQSG